jgi:hypothetical protein
MVFIASNVIATAYGHVSMNCVMVEDSLCLLHPALHQTYLIYWRKKVQGYRNKKHVDDQLNRIENQIKKPEYDILQGNSNRPATYQLKLAAKNLQNERRDATTKRHQHLTFRLETLVIEGKTTQRKAVENILKAERRSNCFRKLAIIEDKGNERHRQLNSLLRWTLTKCRNHSKTPAHNKHRELNNLIREQEKIGWNQVIKGRWSTTWVQVYDSIYPNQGERYAIQQLSAIWKEVIKTWKFRCNTVHDNTQRNQDELLQSFTPTVEALYATTSRLDHIDRKIFEQPISNIMRLPIRQLKTWIHQTNAFVRQAITRSKRREKINTRAITNFFRPRQRAETTTTQISHNTTPKPAQQKHPSEDLRPP